MRRLLTSLTCSLALILALAPSAFAYNDGRGFYGGTDDKVITNSGFILIIFIPILIFALSMLQRHLEKRKDARKAAAKVHAGDSRWRGGW